MVEIYVTTTAFYSDVQMKFAGKQMDLESSILTEEIQTQTKPSQTPKMQVLTFLLVSRS
jgi:hypothetical protein